MIGAARFQVLVSPFRMERIGRVFFAGFAWKDRSLGMDRRIDSSKSAPLVTSELLDRLPPQSLEAERSVLGSLMIDPELCDEITLLLRADDFYADANRRLYGHLQGMHDDGCQIDVTLLVERLKQAGELDLVGGTAYLAELMQNTATAAYAEHYAKIVREKAILRQLIHASTEILRDAWDPTVEVRDILNQAEEKIFAVHDERNLNQVASMYDVLLEAFARIDSRLEHGAATGLYTGLTDLDTLTGGLHASELVILAARPSMGKTALATNIADHVAVELNAGVLFVSLEMSRLELAQRMLCARGRINGTKFRSGFISSEDRQMLNEASAKLSGAPLFIDDSPGRTVTEIAATARRLKRRHNLAMIVIDYLQLIDPDNPKDPRQEQVARIARRLKGLARELEIPVLCLAQLNRQAEATKDNRPRMSHLRESGAIEQDADVVMFVHREEYYHTREEAEARNLRGQAELIVAKQRNGPTDDIKVAWRQEFTRFENLAADSYAEFAAHGEF